MVRISVLVPLLRRVGLCLCPLFRWRVRYKVPRSVPTNVAQYPHCMI